ncbi:MAG: alanine racemase, partial [Candidatus Azotimanducaceae bacterium]
CMGNSGAIMGLPEGHTDWVRPGLMVYGGSPNGAPAEKLQAAMTLSAPILSINRLVSGDAVGYGSSWSADKPCRIAVIALGYADGYPREMPDGTPVLINGKRRPLVGRVSMDMCTVLLEDEDDIQPGHHAIFWGSNLPIDEIAAAAGTISYTLMTGLSHRVKRRYTKTAHHIEIRE